jgi:hypothetical protein
MGSWEGRGPQTDKRLQQSPLTGHFFRLALKASVLHAGLSYSAIAKLYSQKICGYHTNSWRGFSLNYR